MVARNQGASDTDVRLGTQELVRVEHPERQSDDGRDRRQRDVTLGEVEPDTEHLPALPHAATDNPGVGYGGCIRAGARAGEREARDFFATRQARQVVILLLLGAVVIQQLGGSERVRHGDGGGGGGAAAGNFRQDA
jgi:hypothetical protein